MTKADDVRYMKLALSLGRRGHGRVWPNPSVGCVIVDGGRIVGRGRTADTGRPHAETEALAMAGAAAKGATAFVTLEPCAHHGKTPPCAEALTKAGIARVVIALEDPDTRVAGKGIAMLQEAGISVETGVCAAEAEADLAGYLLARRENRAFVTLKLASSFDGRIATATGESQWITGPLARRAVHGLRASHDAVLVGAGTARADDPTLTVRDLGKVSQPVRVVVSRRLDIPKGNLLATLDQAPLWLFHGAEAPADAIAEWNNAGAKCFECPVSRRQVEPAAILKELAKQGITRVFCEGGGSLAASMLAADLVDELVGFTAGLVLGAEGMPAIGAMGLDALMEAPKFRLASSRVVGADLMHRWRRV